MEPFGQPPSSVESMYLPHIPPPPATARVMGLSNEL
jgi:hypothetical protein